jgi:hypothetical protein
VKKLAKKDLGPPAGQAAAPAIPTKRIVIDGQKKPAEKGGGCC